MCFKTDDECSNGRLITAITRIFEIRMDKYVQPNFFRLSYLLQNCFEFRCENDFDFEMVWKSGFESTVKKL